MDDERLAQIEAQWTPNVGPPLNGRQTVLELVGEVRSLREDRHTADARVVEMEYVAKRQSEMFQDVVTERDRLAVHEAKLEAEVSELRAAAQTLWQTVGERDTELSALGGYGADLTLSVSRLLKQRDALQAEIDELRAAADPERSNR